MDIVGARTLRDLLTEREKRFGPKAFLSFVDRDSSVTEFTYAEFVRRVRSVAAGLTAEGIGKGDKVVVHLPNCPEFLFCWFGLNWIGAVAVPSNIANTAGEMQHVVSFSDAVGVVTGAEHADMLGTVADANPAVRLRVLARAEHPEPGWVPFAALSNHGDTPPEVAVASDDVAELLFTSGTTARPKAVMLTHANCLFAGEREWRVLGFDHTDRCLTALPVFHVLAQTISVMASLTVGATLVLLADYSASRFWDHVRRQKATALSMVAMQLRTLLAQPPADSDLDHSVRRISYGINVPDEEKDEFERRFGVELVNGYGLSEAMTMVTVAPVHGEKRWPSIGLPILDRQVRIVDPGGSDVAVGESGELIVSGVPGRNLMKGYYKNPQATAETLRGGWLYTGDNAYFDEHGYVYFVDRLKDVIKVSGENVSSSEVERVLLSHPGVAEAAVVSAVHAISDEVPVAFVVPRPGVRLDDDEVIGFCREHLAKFKVPAVIEVCDELPKTSIGKIEKKLLRKQVQDRGPIT
ncbi:AMP-binding protein [Streptomyces sp. NBC_00035]|uniref:AMP-binding protein n=1 Tax=Streptomyces sp. NBC_00035 TaxID=2903614 RepID=UPI003253047B